MLSIGALSKASGVKVTTIRWYEETGLIPPPQRSAAGQRSYEPKMVARLAFIRHSRELGFAPEAIRSLLALSGQEGCAAADALATAQLDQIRSRIARLQALETELSAMLAAPHDGSRPCRVLEVLADHRLCQHHESHPDTDLRHPV